MKSLRLFLSLQITSGMETFAHLIVLGLGEFLSGKLIKYLPELSVIIPVVFTQLPLFYQLLLLKNHHDHYREKIIEVNQVQ